MKSFDPSAVPLSGLHLLEASAGTGKTHSLADLHLRFLLERDDLDVSRILVVTYTKAAASELRDRLRTRISAALARLRSSTAEQDRVLAHALAAGRDPRDLAIRAEQALAAYDCAPIGTLHGYCRRVLTERMFECDMLSFGEVAAPSPDMEDRIVRAYLRRHPPEGAGPCFDAALRSLAVKVLRSVVRFACGADHLHVVPDPSTPVPNTAVTDHMVLEAFESMRRLWPSHRAAAEAALLDVRVMNQRIYRPAGVRDWMLALDRFFDGELTLDESWEMLVRKLSTSSIERGLKNGCTPPDSPLFDAAGRLADALADAMGMANRLASSWMARMGADAPGLRDTMHDRLNLRTYDELVSLVREAISGVNGARLARTLAADTPVIMVDEFQDTDPAQYAILRRLHEPGGATMILIGDPKQSIYAFRGADIFAYRNAAVTASRHTLSENWRSTPGLVDAVNAMFRRPRAFVLDFIDTADARPATRLYPEQLIQCGKPCAPMTLWRIPSTETGASLNKSIALPMLSDAVSTECARLLDRSEGAFIAGVDGSIRRLGAGDIAVLVSTHAEGERIRASLLKAGVPCVASGPTSVFASREAMDLGVILASMDSPRDLSLLRAALLTRFMGWTCAAVATANGPGFDDVALRWNGYRDQWERSGFSVMFHHWMHHEGIVDRCLASADGERRMTNLRHLGELIAQAESRLRLSPSTVVDWFDLARAGDEVTEESELRLESDADRVRIVTIHKSKGLQYPVVFCPYLWGLPRRSATAPLPVVCHESDTGGDRILDVGSEFIDDHRRRRHDESFQESVRLLYVALTRARLACYTAWGPFRDAASSAMAWLLHGIAGHVPGEPVDVVRDWIEDDVSRDLSALVQASGRTITLCPAPIRPAVALTPSISPRMPEVTSAPRVFQGVMDDGWKISSFSSIKAETRAADDRPDHDELQPVRRRITAGDREPATRFAFPAGPGPGRCLHELLDGLDFSATDEPSLRVKASGLLSRHDIPPRWLDTAVAMAWDTLRTPLTEDGVRLADVSPLHCAHEMQFLIPVSRLTPPALNAALGRMRPDADDLPARLVFNPFHGYLKGFIDLVFEAHGRMYVLDYKSNYLGDSPDDYVPASLEREMIDSDYLLQAMLYATALRRHALARGETPAGFDRRFGGVFYVFLRGLNPNDGPRRGVFHFRPTEGDLSRLSDAFTTRSSASCASPQVS